MKPEARTVGIIVIITSLLMAFFLIISYLIWSQKYSNRLTSGVYLGNLSLGGQTATEAKQQITERLDKIRSAGLKFQYNNKTVTLATDVVSFDADLSYPALVFDQQKMFSALQNYNLDTSYWRYLVNLFRSQTSKKVLVSYKLNEDAVRSFLTDNFSELQVPAKNAFFSVTEDGSGQPALQTNPETPGKEINYEQALAEIKINLDSLTNPAVIIKTQSHYPTVKQADLTKIADDAKKIIGRGNLTLSLPLTTGSTTTQSWEITPKKLITWLSVAGSSGQPRLTLDLEKIKQYLVGVIAPQIDQESIMPRFEIKEGKISSWQKGQAGKKLDITKSANLINQQYLEGKNQIGLLVAELPAPEDSTENIQITELLGTGHSSFPGSPSNRRHNIQVGANAVNGLLIKPGQEFSLLKALGDVNDKTGYLPELVIKGNKTLPEFGGGLCQIGTTVFRAALSSGLPITMRQNHSYRVAYYEPAGTDATIYIPSPDFRFLNDTGNYILIQSRLNKTELYFDFWGVNDGRQATTTYPTIYNIVEPEATKIIETSDLKPGEKKCTEKSHNGADAYFDYTVTYPGTSSSPIIKSRRFRSHYVPWQGVCLVGKSASSSPLSATSSPLSNKKTAVTTTVISIKP